MRLWTTKALWTTLFCVVCFLRTTVLAAPSSSSSTTTTTSHVFVFRHCIRSTNTSVNLYDGATRKESAFSTNISDYIMVPLPEWNTGVEWCTTAGYDHMQKVGSHLWHRYFGIATSLHVQIITDTVQRDVSSAFALAEGIATAAQAAGQVITGLNQPQYDPYLFHPTKKVKDMDLSGSSTGPPRLCEKPSDTQLSQDIATRLSSVVRPVWNMTESLQVLEQYVGVGEAGSLLDMWPPGNNNPNHTESLDEPTLHPTLPKLQGPINVMKLVAQMAFYARTSNVLFLPTMTVPDMMDLLAWHYWMRSVLAIGNIRAAMDGAVVVHRLLQLLEPPQQQSPQDDLDTHPHHVTILMGHDGTLDSIATALDLSWELPPPYPSSLQAAAAAGDSGSGSDPSNNNTTTTTDLPQWSPTPPASALYFASTTSSDPNTQPMVDMRFMAPLFFKNDNPSDPDEYTVDVSGNLIAVPALWNFQHSNAQVLDDAVRVSGNNPIQALRNRMIQVLNGFYSPQAMQCYQTAVQHYPPPANEQPTPSPGTTPSPTSSSPPKHNNSTNENHSPSSSSSSSSSSPVVAPPASIPSPPTKAQVPTVVPPPPPPSQHSNGGGGASGSGSSSNSSNNNNNMFGSSATTTSSPLLFLVVGLVFVGILAVLRKPIARGLGLGSRPIQYSDMDTGHDLDFSMEMI